MGAAAEGVRRTTSGRSGLYPASGRADRSRHRDCERRRGDRGAAGRPTQPNRVPGWTWVFVPLPMFGILALLVYLQTGSSIRNVYTGQVEKEIRERVRSDELFPFPSLH